MLTDLDRLIDVLPIGVYVCEAPGGAIRLYNRRAVELWGREPVAADRFCGSHRLFDAAGHPLAHAESAVAVVLRGTGAVAQEVILERPDGSRVTASMTVSPLHDAGGRLVGAVAAIDDVSNRKATEEALRVSERRYRAMVEGQPEMVCRFLDDGTLTFANPAYRRYFGMPADAQPSSLEPRVFPDDLARVRDAIAGLTPASPSVVVENRVFRGDGQVRWTQWVNHAVFDEQGHRLELQATGRDITEQRQDGEAAAWLAAIVASADDAIVSKTLDGIVTSWNRGAEAAVRLLGRGGRRTLDHADHPARSAAGGAGHPRAAAARPVDRPLRDRADHEGRPARADLAQRVPGPRRPRARDRRLEDRARQQREAARPAAPRGERADAGDALSPGRADRPRP